MSLYRKLLCILAFFSLNNVINSHSESNIGKRFKNDNIKVIEKIQKGTIKDNFASLDLAPFRLLAAANTPLASRPNISSNLYSQATLPSQYVRPGSAPTAISNRPAATYNPPAAIFNPPAATFNPPAATFNPPAATSTPGLGSNTNGPEHYLCNGPWASYLNWCNNSDPPPTRPGPGRINNRWGNTCCAECRYVSSGQEERIQCNAYCRREGCLNRATCTQASQGAYAGYCQSVCLTAPPTLMAPRRIVTPETCKRICRWDLEDLCQDGCNDFPNCNIPYDRCVQESGSFC